MVNISQTIDRDLRLRFCSILFYGNLCKCNKEARKIPQSCNIQFYLTFNGI